MMTTITSKLANFSRMRWNLAAAFLLAAFFVATLPLFAQSPSAPGRWSVAKANAWQAQQEWPVGSNYIPDDAINQLEMWQEATFDPAEINRELGWAQAAGMNTMRVFLHNLLWQQDPAGFKHRINVYLSIAAKHHIKTIFVLFDSCWDPYPHLGPQHPPIPGVHNSGWVQSPGAKMLENSADYSQLEAYVKGIVGAFANDPRVLAWDVWNEPDNTNNSSYGKEEPQNKVALVDNLLPQVFEWARAEHPTQPLTSGIWQGDWTSFSTLSPTAKIQIENSDIITFHNYGWPEQFAAAIKDLAQYHRPIICTEYMARGVGSTIDTILPIARRDNVGAINWGFVNGKTQTNLPWDSWQRPYVLEQPPVWFHDLYYQDGKPYRAREIQIIRALSRDTHWGPTPDPPPPLPIP